MNIEQIAKENDAAILTDKDGDICILARWYDGAGVQITRYQPDPVDHHPQADWEQHANPKDWIA